MRRAALLLFGLAASCASEAPHRVTDLSSGRTYYTKRIRRGLASGKVSFVDARTGEKVTVESSEIREVPEEEFAREAGRE